MRGGRFVGVLAATVAFGTLVVPGAARAAARPGRPDTVGEARAVIQLFYSPPVLVRAGERVDLPVDAACVTSAGTVCRADVTVSARGGGGARWTSAMARAGASLRFDVSAAARRALAAEEWSGSVEFTVSASGSGASASLGTRTGPLTFYVVKSMPTVRVPVAFGHAARGSTALFVPWGSGPGRAGLALGLESATLGPSSFDVDADGRVWLLDGLHHRLLVGAGSGPLASVVVGGTSPDSEIAVGPHGTAYVMSSVGGRLDRPVHVLRVPPGSGGASAAVTAGRGLPVRLAVAGSMPFVHMLPSDEWTQVGGPNGQMTPGRPLGGGEQLLSVVRDGAVRLGTAHGNTVRDAVELVFPANVGDLQLAAPDGAGGYVVVVHLWRDRRDADQYQVVHVSGGRVMQTFAVARRDFARTAALSAFRLGPNGSLFQLTSSPDGVRVLRYRIGGAA
jgi:hypothetical protein